MARAGHRAARPRAAGAPTLAIHPLTPSRWDDFVTLFGPRGACAGCWCMWPRLTRAEWEHRGDRNRRAIRRIVDSGEPPGLIAYDRGSPVGWIALAPRGVYRRLERSRAMAPVDDQPVWSTPCFFVARGARGRGITIALLRAACDYVAARGGRLVEGYPIDARGKTYAPAFAWHGLEGLDQAAGFSEVARRSPTRPIMRRALRPRRAASRG